MQTYAVRKSCKADVGGAAQQRRERRRRKWRVQCERWLEARRSEVEDSGAGEVGVVAWVLSGRGRCLGSDFFSWAGGLGVEFGAWDWDGIGF